MTYSPPSAPRSPGHALTFHSGPVGLLLGYAFVGTITFSVMVRSNSDTEMARPDRLLVPQVSLGEMMSYLPIAGGHITMAERFVSKGFSFLLGWNYWYNWTIILPAELRFVVCGELIPFFPQFRLLRPPRSAAAVLIGYWNDVISPAVWITICMVVVICINMLGAGMRFVFDEIPLRCSPKVVRCIRRSRIRLRVRKHNSVDRLTHTDNHLTSQLHQGPHDRCSHHPRNRS